jgi:NAD(P)-dependent dehydrogenase (short-subunit alcohol dehydrogenase family)
MDTQLNGKRALVTGASSGIGRAIAEALAREGARVAVHGRSEDRVSDTLDSIAAAGGDAFAVTADMRVTAEIGTMCRAALDELGGIDVVVNNAGIFEHALIVDMTEEFWDETMDIDLKAPFLVTKHTLPVMLAQGTGGSLIYLTSTSSKTADAHFSAYNAAKAGLLGFARCVAAEVGKHGIRVNGISPGWIDTKMVRAFYDGWPGEKPAEYETFLEEDGAGTNMLKRVGEPEDIAEMAVYMASDKGRFITGQAIGICGGLVYW